MLYFGSSKNLSGVRNDFLDGNKEIFLKTMHLLLVSENEFSEDYRKDIKTLHMKMRKTGQSNSLYERDIIKIVNFFQKHLAIKEELNLSGNSLVDYMYNLSKKFHNRYYDELFSKVYVYKNKEEIEREDYEVPKEKIKAGLKYPRNQLLPKKVVTLANYLCEVNKEHKYFTSNSTNRNYVEAHHLIPLANQNKFETNLDVIENMVSLCVVCHKKIHHATFDEKEAILIKLYQLKEKGLIKAGVKVHLNEFLEFYKNTLNETDE